MYKFFNQIQITFKKIEMLEKNLTLTRNLRTNLFILVLIICSDKSLIAIARESSYNKIANISPGKIIIK